MNEKIVIAGSGAIATGLAATVASHYGDVTLLCRSTESAERAGARATKLLERVESPAGAVSVITDADGIGDATIAIEAIVEELGPKAELLAGLDRALGDDAILASTTSSLPVTELAAKSGRPSRFVGFHVFNPVPRMELIEVVYPDGTDDDVIERTRALAQALKKTGVEVPDTPGFVVNRLLFPYLFDAVRLMEETGLEPDAIDSCMKLGAGHPMGPLALLDFVGLDVSIAIGEQVGVDIPQSARDLLAAGKLGKKAGAGFYTY